MKARFLALLLVSLCSCGSVGQVIPVVSNIVAAVQDATLIVDQIVGWVDDYFKTNPDPGKEAEVRRAVQSVRSTLVSGARGQNLAAFRLAYAELLRSLGELPNAKVAPAMKASPGGYDDTSLDITNSTTGDRLSVPSPMAYEK